MESATLAFAPPCGPIHAWDDGAVVRATGIPYAAADRFAAPVPARDWTEPFAATEPSPACPQARSRFLAEVLGDALAGMPRDEHCQRLSITLPRQVRTGEQLPVMVWIHGGSYTSGAGDAPIMDPARLVAEQRVIVVAVTYRLGLFGFLGSGRTRPANLGLLDQLEALRWVQRNIRAFGGDPDHVTLFGQSSGGDAVAHLMAAPGAESLFRRAILQSPPLGLSRDRRGMQTAMARAAEAATADMSAAEVLALQAEVQRRAASFGLMGQMAFGTQYGHHPLPAEHGIDAAWDGAAPQIDILIGHTAEEARLYLPTVPALQRAIQVPLLGPLVRRAVVKTLTAAVYSRAIRRFAGRHARAGGTAHRYVLSWAVPGNPYGSAHTIDLPLLLGTRQAWAASRLLAGASWETVDGQGRRLRRLWADFARGVPLQDKGCIPGLLSHRRIKRPAEHLKLQ
ncbi:carboxylic ester hydrolase [Arthrobacter mangrovi]|uniref:Carboxylic ester hydrolase n=2 Tax=Arthrobacter mangrovi TaxID=2966350 RepID=A0ABQ5MX40_9MICC|nr:carboxylesterase family protein [Arthrobacter mangrovi]GLB68505.1 carboxylic ester hydrolase [Arthrobacter mangrovi]